MAANPPTIRAAFGPFSLQLVGGWTLISVVLGGPADAPPADDLPLPGTVVRPFQRNLIVTLENVGPDVTLDEYLARQQHGLDEAEVGYERAPDVEHVVTAGGHDGVITEQVITGNDGERVRQMQLLVKKDGVAFTAIASHLDGPPFDAVRDEFRVMLLSFE